MYNITKLIRNNTLYYIVLLLLLMLWLISPVLLLYIQTGVRLSLWRSTLLSMCVSALILLPTQRWVKAIFFILMCISTGVELFMVKQFGVLLTHAHALTIFGTNMQETTNLFSANLSAFSVLIPFLLSSILLFYFVWKIRCGIGIRLGSIVGALTMLIGVVSMETLIVRIPLRESIDKLCIQRVPINFWENMVSASVELFAISCAEDMTFGAYRTIECPGKEVVVLAIGESVRYHNFSMNGTYERETTPYFANNPNVILFSDYTTTGCITMLAVPMILTRGTPDSFDLTYKECGVQKVFRESGFYVVAFQNNLIGDRLHSYLLNGSDEVIVPKSDTEIPSLVDSLAQYHSHLMVYFQLMGSHAYYDNYPMAYNLWRPNINSDPNVVSDSLLLNAYDNTILYTDYLLNDLLVKLDNRGGRI